MQMLFERSFEHGEYQGLGLIKGDIVRFDVPLKIPHMGWNTLEITQDCPLFKGVQKTPYVYFVHSYHAETADDVVCAYTTYGKRVPVAVWKDNVYGVQFHPEKSGEDGIQMLRQFAALEVQS